MQGELLGLRLPGDEDTEMESGETPWRVGELQFDDGGMRGLAAFVCWMGLVYRCSKENVEELTKPGAVSLARQLLQLPTMRKTQGTDMAYEQIKRIIRQNVESKKMAISSFEWSEILRGMNKHGRKISVAEALELYNNSPEITAHGGGSAKDPIEKMSVSKVPQSFTSK